MTLKRSIKDKVRFNQMPLSILRNQKGVTAVLVAIVVAMLLGFTALAIDVGYMYSTRNELQNVADAAALAGAGELGRIYLGLDSAIPDDFDIDDTGVTPTYRSQIEAMAQATALKNKAADVNISIRLDDIFIGVWNYEWKDEDDPDITKALDTTGSEPPDAVRVIARRDSKFIDGNGPVPTFFGGIFKIFGGNADFFQVSAVATAALSGEGKVEEGVLKTPFAISENVLENCPNEIIFSPTNASCAGWHNYNEWPANPEDIKDKMYEFIKDHEDGTVWLNTYGGKASTLPEEGEPPPPIETGEDIAPIGGDAGKLFNGYWYSEWERTNDSITPVTGSLEDGPITSGKNYAPFMALFDFYRFRDDDGDLNENGNVVLFCDIDDEPETIDTMPPDEVWTTFVPVYKDTVLPPDCTNPRQAMEVVDFAKIQILMAEPPPGKKLKVCLTCDWSINPGSGHGGGGGKYKSDKPGLVQ